MSYLSTNRASYQRMPNITIGKPHKPKKLVVVNSAKPLPEKRPGMYLGRSDAALCAKAREHIAKASTINDGMLCSVELTEAYRILRDLCKRHNKL